MKRRVARSHGESRKHLQTPEYRAWAHMKTRCFDPRATQRKYYQDRGITVCPAWRDSYEQFLADVGRRPSAQHSLDRINNNGHYEPGNVRWATKEQQMGNKRTSLLLTFQGRTQHARAWARELGIDPPTLYGRLDAMGWSVERALSTPVRKMRRHHRDAAAS